MGGNRDRNDCGKENWWRGNAYTKEMKKEAEENLKEFRKMSCGRCNKNEKWNRNGTRPKFRPAASSKGPDIVVRVAIVAILKGGAGTSGTIRKDCDNSKTACQ